MPDQQGFAHLMLSVTDVVASAAWYRDVFGGASVAEGKDDHSPLEVIVAGNLMVGFRAHPGTATGDRFTETRIGLDHVAIATTDDQIEAWRARLDELGIPNSGIVEDPWGKHLNFRDPDNIALEIYAGPTGQA